MEEEFWELTLKEFNALIGRYKDTHDWLNYRTALICSVLANIWRGRKGRVFSPEDFMPGAERRAQTPKQMWNTVQMLNAAFGGSVKEN